MSVVNRLKFIFSADTREFQKQTNEGKKAVSEFANQGKSLLDKFASAFGINTKAIGDGIGSIGKSAASLGTGFSAAAGGTNKLSAAMKLLKVAMASTGVGLLIVALGSLVAYFTKTQRGIDKVKLVMESFKAIINVLIDRIASFGEGVFMIFTGKFREGAEKLRGAFQGLGEEIKTEAKEAWNLEKRFQALQDREIEMMNVISAHRRRFDELRLAAEDSNNTIEQRRNLLMQASEEEKKAIAIEVELQKERVDISRSRLKMSESLRGEIGETAEEEAKLNQIYERGASAQKELASQVRGLDKALIDQAAAALKAQKALDAVNAVSMSWADAVKMPDASQLMPVYQDASAKMKSLADEYALAGQVFVDTGALIQNSLTGVTVAFSEYLGGMLAGSGNLKGLVALMGASMADFAITLGKTAISSGIAVGFINKMLKNPANWPAAVGAGAALVALGTALKARMAGMSTGISGGGGGGGSYGSIAGGSTSFVYDNRVNVKSEPIKVVVGGQFFLRGHDLVATVTKASERNERILGGPTVFARPKRP